MIDPAQAIAHLRTVPTPMLLDTRATLLSYLTGDWPGDRPYPWREQDTQACARINNELANRGVAV